METKKRSKRLLAWIVAMFMVVSLVPQVSFAAVQESDTIKIDTQDEWVEFLTNVYGGNSYANKLVELNTDIDMADVELTFKNTSFSGFLEGNGHTLKNVKAALFGTLSSGSYINDLGIESGSIEIGNEGSGYAAAFVYNNFGTIYNCYNRADVSITCSNRSPQAGGICINGSTINCYNTGNITAASTLATGYAKAAGISVSGKKLQNCYNTGAIVCSGASATSGSNQAAGIVVSAASGAIVENCYNTGEVTYNGEGAAQIGEIVANAATGSTIKNCFSNGTDIAGAGVVDSSCQIRSDKYMKTAAFITALNGEQGTAPWAADSAEAQTNNGYPVLKTIDISCPVTGITLDQSELTVELDCAATLTATLEPENALIQNIVWESSDPSVATVAAGRITARAPGTATITVTSIDGNFVKECKVTVPEQGEITYDSPAKTVKTYGYKPLNGENNDLAVYISNLCVEKEASSTKGNAITGDYLGMKDGIYYQRMNKTNNADPTYTFDADRVMSFYAQLNYYNNGSVTNRNQVSPYLGTAANAVECVKHVKVKDASGTKVVAEYNEDGTGGIFAAQGSDARAFRFGISKGVLQPDTVYTIVIEPFTYLESEYVLRNELRFFFKTQPRLAQELTLDKETMDVAVGGTETLTASVAPEDTANKEVTWSSDNEEIAAVDENGEVTGKAEGTANITATTADGTKLAATCEVTVKPNIASSIEEIELSKTEYTYDGTAKEPYVTGTELVEGKDYTIEYKDNVNAGTAKVIITGKGSYAGTATKEFTISKAEQTVSAEDSYEKAYGADPFKLDAKATGLDNAETGAEISYSSDNTKVATVSEAGEVTITGAGTANLTIKAAATENYKEASKTVTLKVTPTAQTISAAASYKKAYGAKAFSLNAKAIGLNKAATGAKLTYSSSNTKVAKVSSAGKVTITGTGTVKLTIKAAATTNYKAASKTVTLTVTPKKVTSVKVKAGTKSMKVSWKKDTKATGYQITYAQNKKFTKSKKNVTVKSYKTTSKTIKKLKKGKTYYVKVRAYKTVSGKKLYGSYSAVKSVKIKK